jgi:hypothetical protein
MYVWNLLWNWPDELPNCVLLQISKISEALLDHLPLSLIRLQGVIVREILQNEYQQFLKAAEDGTVSFLGRRT